MYKRQQYIIAALDAMGVKKIDYLVASHPHIDHIGGMAALMDRYEVGIHYSTAVSYTHLEEALRMQAAGEKVLKLNTGNPA